MLPSAWTHTHTPNGNVQRAGVVFVSLSVCLCACVFVSVYAVCVKLTRVTAPLNGRIVDNSVAFGTAHRKF